mmetsp:Transcript_35653/g.113551  ORF Transcript_35653/g.113551 Transcript_35653/m.113551 type:complete len:256 (-) Transcript_35653:47-814(-)
MSSSGAGKVPVGEALAASSSLRWSGSGRHRASSRSSLSCASPPCRRASRIRQTSPCLVAMRVSLSPSELRAPKTWTTLSNSRMPSTRDQPIPSSARDRCSAAFALACGLRWLAQPANAPIALPSDTQTAMAASARLASSAMKPLDSAHFLMSTGVMRSTSASMCLPIEQNISRKAIDAFLARAERSESENWRSSRLSACSCARMAASGAPTGCDAKRRRSVLMASNCAAQSPSRSPPRSATIARVTVVSVAPCGG